VSCSEEEEEVQESCEALDRVRARLLLMQADLRRLTADLEVAEARINSFVATLEINR